MKILLTCCLFLSLGLSAQSIEEDSATYQATFDWVERKLTYNYYDNTNQHYWVNRFQLNENGAITIKNIAAKNPNKVVERRFHNRTFYLYDLNPRSISIIELATDQGRFVKGKIVRVEGFKGEKKIASKHDGVVGSDLSFIHISVPEFLEDSLENYADQVKEQFAKVAALNARLANQGDMDSNIENAFKVLSGNYLSKDSTATLKFEKLEDHLVSFRLQKGDKKSYGMIGFDKEESTIYLLKSSGDSRLFKQFTFDETTRDLVLKDDDDTLFLIGRNTFKINVRGWSDTYFRD